MLFTTFTDINPKLTLSIKRALLSVFSLAIVLFIAEGCKSESSASSSASGMSALQSTFRDHADYITDSDLYAKNNYDKQEAIDLTNRFLSKVAEDETIAAITFAKGPMLNGNSHTLVLMNGEDTLGRMFPAWRNAMMIEMATRTEIVDSVASYIENQGYLYNGLANVNQNYVGESAYGYVMMSLIPEDSLQSKVMDLAPLFRYAVENPHEGEFPFKQ